MSISLKRSHSDGVKASGDFAKEDLVELIAAKVVVWLLGRLNSMTGVDWIRID